MKKKINIIGGGPSALMLASELNPLQFEVCVYERNSTLGRKFLVAGQGGFNLTHSEIPEQFIKRYSPSAFLEPAFLLFNNQHFAKWLLVHGIETFVGSSGRVFPIKGLKPIQVLEALLLFVHNRGVQLIKSMEWRGFTQDGHLVFNRKNGEVIVKGDLNIFCLGGASWPKTGSKGEWINYFRLRGVKANDFKASNCAFKIDWPISLLPKLEGKAIKNCTITCEETSHPGEVVLTAFGIEGSGIYPLSPLIRKGLMHNHEVEIQIDFKPSINEEILLEKLKVKKRKGSYSEHIRTALNLSDTHFLLLKHFLNKEDFLNPRRLVFFIKHFPLKINGTGPIEHAISTVGGIDLSEISEYFEFKKIKNNFAIGEMLDYDAPTGGYLLQSCFSMGYYLAQHLNNTLR